MVTKNTEIGAAARAGLHLTLQAPSRNGIGEISFSANMLLLHF